MTQETYLEIFGTPRWRHKRWLTSEEYNENKDVYDSLSRDFEFIVDGKPVHPKPKPLSLEQEILRHRALYGNSADTENHESKNSDDKFNFDYKIYGKED